MNDVPQVYSYAAFGAPFYPGASFQGYTPYHTPYRSYYYPVYVMRVPPAYRYYEEEMRLAQANALELKDYGQQPIVLDIEDATLRNENFRTALWTGKHMQMTVMSIPVGQDIGLEIHPTTDQFIRLEQGQGLVEMGDAKDRLDYRAEAKADDAILIPAGKWHNVTNTGDVPLKVYVLYAPPQHPFGTVHVTKADAMAAEA